MKYERVFKRQCDWGLCAAAIVPILSPQLKNLMDVLAQIHFNLKQTSLQCKVERKSLNEVSNKLVYKPVSCSHKLRSIETFLTTQYNSNRRLDILEKHYMFTRSQKRLDGT